MRTRPLLAAVAATLATAAPAGAAGDPVMPLRDVHAGMRCTGYSVVRGTEVAAFDVMVLDVVDRDPAAAGPRILVTASGPAVDRTGLGPGFSGSPIYCRDAAGVARNIGAISESIGEYGGRTVLATPIEAILANRPDAPRGRPPWVPATARASSAPAQRAERRMRREGVRPLAGPLTVSGLDAPLARALAAAGRRVGRPVLAPPAGPLGSFPAQRLRPGSAVSVGYSTGDIRVGAIGTVAYTDGDAVWAFGHPFEAAGARSLLLQDAWVYHVVNDPATDGLGSYKLAAPGHDLGVFSNDALAAVVGRVGALPPTIPIRVRAHDDDTGHVEVLRVRAPDETAVGNPVGFSPIGQVAPLTVLQAGSTVLGAAPARLTGRMCLSVAFRGSPRVARFCNRYLSSFGAGDGSNGVAEAAAFDAFDALAVVDAYVGRPPHVRRVDATLHIARGERVADLRRVRAPRTVRPGQRVPLRVTLQRLHDGRFTRTVHVRLPKRLRHGHRRLVLAGYGDDAGGGSDAILELLLGKGRARGARNPATLDQLIDAVAATGLYDGVRGLLAGRRFRAFRDPDLLITGHAATRVRVLRRR